MSFHLAGIIPVAGQQLDFNMPWHDALMPLAPDYLMVERSVMECAYAGCETIWIVCDDRTQPLIRYKIGEMVQDPVWLSRTYEIKKKDFQKPIRIYYVPIFASDVNKRDCLSWSVIHGSSVALKISRGLSKWLAPSKFYVSWPYGYYDPSTLRAYRETISSSKDVYLAHNELGVKDDEYLGFSFGPETLRKLKLDVREKSTGLWKDKDKKERLSLEDRFSYRKFSLRDVFNDVDFEEQVIINIDDYYRIDSWEGYCDFISSDVEVKKPSKYLLSYKEWNGMGVEDE